MSDRIVTVTTPSRLHLGMLSFGRSDVRQFGGVGLMVDRPGIRLQITAADQLEASGPLSDRALDFADRAITALDLPTLPASRSTLHAPRISIQSAPRQHVGLGVGTQLGLAVAAGLNAFYGRPPLSPADLALASGRAERSSIGVHGFASGGLLVEAGKFAGGHLSPLVSRIELPPTWRFVLLIPRDATGLHGDEERAAFRELPPVPLEVTDQLCREVVLELAPAAVEENFLAFSQSLYRFGHRAGGCFAPKQPGPFLDEATAKLVHGLRGMGYIGVGQSSWGPSLFVAIETESSAPNLIARLRADIDVEHYDFVLTSPNNHGAHIEIATRPRSGEI